MEHVTIAPVISKGEGLLASHTISVKDTIYSTNDPVISAISAENLTDFCYHCHAGSKSETSWYSIGQYRDARLQECSACRVVRFCGKQCQSLAWKQYHKFECKKMAKFAPRILHESVRAVQRFCLQRDNGIIGDELWQKLLKLTSHMDDLRRKGGADWRDLMLYAKAAHEYSETKINLQVVLKLMCILKSNGLILQTTYGDPIGVFIDPILVKINHSCDGNVFVHRPIYTNTTGWLQSKTSNEGMIKLLPLREIREGEELTMPYVDLNDDLDKRRADLRKNYFFLCTCNKCIQDETTKHDLQVSNSKLSKRLAGWQSEAEEQLKSLKNTPLSLGIVVNGISKLEAIANGMEKETSLNPATNPYSRIIHELKLLNMDRQHACDQALLYALKEHFVVGFSIYSSPIHPTRIVNAIYLLQVFGLLDETFNPGHGHVAAIEQARKNFEARGFSRRSFLHWRLRICVDIRRHLVDSAMTDMANCFEMEQVSIGINDRHQIQELLTDAIIKEESEQEMRKILGLTKERWKEVLNRYGP